MKKELVLILPFIFSIAFASAQGFGNFGFINLFSSFNVSMYLTALLFATIFAVIYFILGKTPLGDNTAVRWIIALCAASFSIWGIISSGFSFENFLFRYGISGDILPTVLWMAAAIIALILIAKVGFRNFLAIIFGLGGAVLIALSIFGALHEQGAGLVIGIILLLIGFAIHKKAGGYVGRGILGAGKIGWSGAKWAGGKFPRGNFLKSERRIKRKIKKLERKYSKAINRNNLQEADILRKDIEYLRGRLQNVMNQEQKSQRQYQQYAKRVNYSPKGSGSTALVPTDKHQIKKSIKILRDQYNAIQKQNPRDSRLYQIVKDIKELKRRL